MIIQDGRLVSRCLGQSQEGLEYEAKHGHDDGRHPWASTRKTKEHNAADANYPRLNLATMRRGSALDGEKVVAVNIGPAILSGN